MRDITHLLSRLDDKPREPARNPEYEAVMREQAEAIKGLFKTLQMLTEHVQELQDRMLGHIPPPKPPTTGEC